MRAGAGGMDGAMRLGMTISVLWHLFWFFSLSINVTSGKMSSKPRPRIVSLGPVLDDSIFRMLAETKPQISEAFYRHLSDFSLPPPAPKTIERHLPGDVVSVPFGKNVFLSLKGLIGGTKSSPEYELTPQLGIQYPESFFVIEGEVKDRPVMNTPEKPALPAEEASAFKDAVTEIQFVVDPEGAVTAAYVSASSGRSNIDSAWLDFTRQWRFSPLEPGKLPLSQKGKARFGFSARSEE